MGKALTSLNSKSVAALKQPRTSCVRNLQAISTDHHLFQLLQLIFSFGLHYFCAPPLLHLKINPQPKLGKDTIALCPLRSQKENAEMLTSLEALTCWLMHSTHLLMKPVLEDKVIITAFTRQVILLKFYNMHRILFYVHCFYSRKWVELLKLSCSQLR